jgi:hypothetical protein
MEEVGWSGGLEPGRPSIAPGVRPGITGSDMEMDDPRGGGRTCELARGVNDPRLLEG